MNEPDIDFEIQTVGGRVESCEGDRVVHLTLHDQLTGRTQHMDVLLSQLVAGAIQAAQRNDALRALSN